MNARKKAKKYKALYEKLRWDLPYPLVVRDRQPITTLKASILVSPEEMEAGIPFETILARKFTEALEDYMVIEKERLTASYAGIPISNNYIRITGTIKIVGGDE